MVFPCFCIILDVNGGKECLGFSLVRASQVGETAETGWVDKRMVAGSFVMPDALGCLSC